MTPSLQGEPHSLSSLVRVTDAATEPVSLSEAKAHLRVVFTSDDAYITSLIKVARCMAEDYCRRALVTQTWQAGFDHVHSREISLPRPRLISVGSVKVYSDDRVLITVDPSEYQVDISSEPGRIFFADGLPDMSDERLPRMLVSFTAGYGPSAADVPAPIGWALRLLIEHLYRHRAAVDYTAGTPWAEMPLGVRSLLNPYKIWMI